MDEEQCHRPRERRNMRPPTRGKREKRITGWLAGHEIHLEIEDVLDKKNIVQQPKSLSDQKLLYPFKLI